MKMIFVDAENVGLKSLEKMEASVIDKVFVFSKSDSVKLACEHSLYLHLSGYPNGSNQADFYIIAYLSRILNSLNKKELNSIRFELLTNDESLISAFEFQCSQLGAVYESVRTKDDTVVQLSPVPAPKPKQLSPEDRIYANLKSPKALDPAFQQQLGLSKSVFSKAVNELAKSKKIRRSSESKKKWMRC
ncbi:hypothetical protein AB6E22_22510 [Vibrio cyclitrophicus]|uniref:hypothetical protein n=1 Tax=Vibrio cyclitrophicus TaxID=47951 RepID=UPI00036F9919|nr:hypothetical protein [Vibrio cyclitrophicus]OEF75592.1 hypothetical protein OA5_05360 [Vibrio cyclitrophicus 1F111]